jgi:hypothetical protein
MNRAPPINLNASKTTENASRTVFLIGFLVIIVLVGIVLLYFFRDKIFKKGKVLANNKTYQTEQGFGSYSQATIGSCLTASNSCEDTGNQTVTQKCVPNPITGLGCIDDNGNQTFNDKITRQNCNPICRSYILLENDSFVSGDPLFFSTCNYPTPYDSNTEYPCLPNTKIGGYNTVTYTCYPNDSNGINECSYKCSDIGQKNPGQNIPYEEQTDTFYYIPACDPKLTGKTNPKTKAFTLNSFPWEIGFNLPANGITISKGFTIKNNYNSDGTVNLKTFNIIPAYKPPRGPNSDSPTPVSEITIEQLSDLDNNIYTYAQCDVLNPKSICSKYYYYNPTDIESGITQGNLNTISLTYKPPPSVTAPTLSAVSNLRKTKNCFTYPYYNNDSLFRNNVSYNDFPTSLYNPEGIGSFGYATEQQICSSTVPVLTQVGTTINYLIPQNDGTICFPYKSVGSTQTNINSLKKSECLLSDPGISNSITTTNNSNGTYNLQNLPGSINVDHSGYPPDSNTVYNTCKTVYPEITTINGNPGILSTCQYYPDNSVLDFSNYLDTPLEVKNLIGVYSQFMLNNVIFGYDQYYFMTLQSTPCDCTSTNFADCANSSEILQTPLGFCNGNTGTYAGSIPILAVFSGGINGGDFWNRPGCDSELISVVSSIELMISPRGPVGDGSGDILCDIYAYFNSTYYGYLTYNYGNNGTVDCAFLSFQPLENNTTQLQYTCINNSCNASTLYPKFRLGYSSADSNYYLLAADPAYSYPSASNYTYIISLPTYNGTNLPTPSDNINFFDNNLNVSPNKVITSTNTTSFENFVYVKTSGLYVGQDVGNLINEQKTNPCFNNTCNLFYTDTPEFCN